MADISKLTVEQKSSFLTEHVRQNKDRRRQLETQISLIETVIADNTARLANLKAEYDGLDNINAILTNMALPVEKTVSLEEPEQEI